MSQTRQQQLEMSSNDPFAFLQYSQVTHNNPRGPWRAEYPKDLHSTRIPSKLHTIQVKIPISPKHHSVAQSYYVTPLSQLALHAILLIFNPLTFEGLFWD